MKCDGVKHRPRNKWSRPARGGWIEIPQNSFVVSRKPVPPRVGRDHYLLAGFFLQCTAQNIGDGALCDLDRGRDLPRSGVLLHAALVGLDHFLRRVTHRIVRVETPCGVWLF